jgi:hypothetical protein
MLLLLRSSGSRRYSGHGPKEKTPNMKLLPLTVLLFILSAKPAQSQTASEVRHGREQSNFFSTEQGSSEPLVKRPVSIPDAVLQILKTDDGVQSCLENNPLTPGEPLNSWFIASEVHLDGAHESDLIVLPNASSKGDVYLCFHSVSGIGWFWVFRPIGRGYLLALAAPGDVLNILNARTSGYRDIQTKTGTAAGRFLTTTTFRFGGERYQEYRKDTREIQ